MQILKNVIPELALAKIIHINFSIAATKIIHRNFSIAATRIFKSSKSCHFCSNMFGFLSVEYMVVHLYWLVYPNNYCLA